MSKYTFSLDSLKDDNKIMESADISYTFDGDEMNIDQMLYHFTLFLKAASYFPNEIIHLNKNERREDYE